MMQIIQGKFTKSLPEEPVVLLFGSEGDLKSVPRFNDLNIHFHSRREMVHLPPTPGITGIISEDPSVVESWIYRIRGNKYLALFPLLVFSSSENLSRKIEAVDKVYTPILTREKLLGILREWKPFLAKMDNFAPLPVNLTNREHAWIILLRYLLLRNKEKLEPIIDINSRIGYSFVTAEALLQTIDFDCCDAELQALQKRGFLRNEFADMIHLCGDCGYFNLNFREVCPRCRSANLADDKNIHHFRCGFVGSESEFLAGDMRCPKCRRRLKHIGVDYDLPSVSFRCLCCGEVSGEPIVSCLCIKCGKDFPVEEAGKLVIKRYFLTPEGKHYAMGGPYRKSGMIKSEVGLLDFEVFEQLFTIQTAIAERTEKSLLLILIRGDNTDLFGDKDNERSPIDLTGLLAATIKKTLRTQDFMTIPPTGGILALAAETSRKKAYYIIERISNAFRGSSVRPVITFFEHNKTKISLKKVIEKLYSVSPAELTGYPKSRTTQIRR